MPYIFPGSCCELRVVRQASGLKISGIRMILVIPHPQRTVRNMPWMIRCEASWLKYQASSNMCMQSVDEILTSLVNWIDIEAFSESEHQNHVVRSLPICHNASALKHVESKHLDNSRSLYRFRSPHTCWAVSLIHVFPPPLPFDQDRQKMPEVKLRP